MPAIVNPCVDDFSGLAFQVVSYGYRSSLNVMTEVDEGVEIHCNGVIESAMMASVGVNTSAVG